MNTIRKIIILAAILAVVLTALFPPYAAGIRPVGENIHSGIGHHPFWKRPTVEYAYAVLHKIPYDPSAGVDLGDYFVMFNKVGFIFQLAAIVTVSSLLLLVLRKKRGYRKDRPESKASPA